MPKMPPKKMPKGMPPKGMPMKAKDMPMKVKMPPGMGPAMMDKAKPFKKR